MPLIHFNRLQKRLARGCIFLMAFPLALRWGDALGAYLPFANPVPLRFRAVIRPKIKKINVSPITASPMAESGNSLGYQLAESTDLSKLAPDPFYDFYTVPWSFGSSEERAAAPQTNNTDVAHFQMDAIKTISEDPTVVPEFLVPFFTGPFGGTNAAATVRIVEFNPPIEESQRSSTATYSSN